MSSKTFSSSSISRKPWPVAASPDVGSESKYLVDANFAVFTVCSALVPPMTIAKWYGGQAAVPIERNFSSSHFISDVGFSTAFVSWYKNDLLALPPPLAINRKLYSSA